MRPPNARVDRRLYRDNGGEVFDCHGECHGYLKSAIYQNPECLPVILSISTLITAVAFNIFSGNWNG